ncbi:MAG TPA: tRNA 4-thiouridine(8) synthase ThiI [bacterium]|mgnify:CR=1 FL=1|nr:tRNA 4-thiouridine(8) synthase ThiI [bacterium]
MKVAGPGKHNHPVIALALVSSGLDSLLAARLIKDQDVEVQGVTYLFSFDIQADRERQEKMRALFDSQSIPVRFIDISEAFLPVLKDPPHGYGSGVNPCIDCHLFMIRHAGTLMESMGARFLITGEVVGQRPMSQTKPVLFHIDKASGLRGLILRPLSALRLPPTIPETEGWVDREKLRGIAGRSRKEQIRLARQMGIHGYSTPAGGCILTDPEYAGRVKMFLRIRGKEQLTVPVLRLMRVGRHLWPHERIHVVVGRHEEENRILESFEGYWKFHPEDHKGPLVLADGLLSDEDIDCAASITARYSGPRRDERRIVFEGARRGVRVVRPLDEETLEAWRV